MKKAASSHMGVQTFSSSGVGQSMTGEDRNGRMQHSPAIALMLVEARYERIHAALMLAVTACALGQRVILFGMGSGTRAFCKDWSGLEESEREAGRLEAGVAGIETLREALFEFDEASFHVCDSGIRSMKISEDQLCDAVTVMGLPGFLELSQGARLAVF